MKGFGPVAPPHILASLREHNVLGTYHLLLAHDVLRQAEKYRNLFQNRAYPNKWVVILDNSVVELGDACDANTISEAAAACQANVVVLPDVLLDGAATVQRTKSAIAGWKERLDDAIEIPYSFMVVPQGKTIEEWTQCAEQLADLPYVNWWGIPRNFREYIGPRRIAVEIARMLNPSRNIHLLGFSEDIVDDILTARYLPVAGIDSAVPLRAASLGKAISLFTTLPPRGNWWEEVAFDYLMVDNVKQVRKWLNGMDLDDWRLSM